MSQYKVDFDTLPWDVPMSGVRHRFENRGAKKLRLVEYSKEMEPHWCSRGHIGIILEGQFEIRYDDETVVYNPGDGVYIPSGEEHRHMAVALTEKVRMFSVEEA